MPLPTHTSAKAPTTKRFYSAVSCTALVLTTLLLASCASSSSHDAPRTCAQRAHAGQSCR